MHTLNKKRGMAVRPLESNVFAETIAMNTNHRWITEKVLEDLTPIVFDAQLAKG